MIPNPDWTPRMSQAMKEVMYFTSGAIDLEHQIAGIDAQIKFFELTVCADEIPSLLEKRAELVEWKEERQRRAKSASDVVHEEVVKAVNAKLAKEIHG